MTTDFTKYIDLASRQLGGAVVLANDEFFAAKENLLNPEDPIWKEGVYTDRGKWMDGWETRRRRTPGHDWSIVRLGLAGLLRGVVVDTSFFRGNYAETCSIEACAIDGQPHPETLAEDNTEWVEILPKSALNGHEQNTFELDTNRRFTHLRFNIYPDGGVARLRVHGQPLPNLDRWGRLGEIDLGAIENGGRVVVASDMFFGDANNLFMPGRGKNMGDGWETKRRRGPGYDWVVVQLGAEGFIEHIEVDTNHFKGNYPDRFSLEGCRAPNSGEAFHPDDHQWHMLHEQTKLQAHTRHHFGIAPTSEPVTHVRFNIYPDGGVSRLRLHGQVSQRGWRNRKLQWLNTLPSGSAAEAFLNCCGSTLWASQMVQSRPFSSLDAVVKAADRSWSQLDESDYLEAFEAHPKIGEQQVDAGQTEQAAGWSKGEQAAAHAATEAVRRELHTKNLAYQDRYGFIFIVCASGKSADEMLQLLQERLGNNRGTEIKNAAEEQRQITRLRLEKLLSAPKV